MNAQTGYDEIKHEVAVGYGVGSNSNVISIYGDALGDWGTGLKRADESWIGPVSVEYFYYLKKWLGVGGVFVYSHMKQNTYFDGKKHGENKNNYFTLMPAVKFDWLRKKHFGMYSKFAIGVTLRKEKRDRVAHNPDSNEQFNFNWQASLLGMEVGSNKVRGFVELGMGEQGIALSGVRYKF